MRQKIYRAATIGHAGAGNYGHGLHLAYEDLENVQFIPMENREYPLKVRSHRWHQFLFSCLACV